MPSPNVTSTQTGDNYIQLVFDEDVFLSSSISPSALTVNVDGSSKSISEVTSPASDQIRIYFTDYLLNGQIIELDYDGNSESVYSQSGSNTNYLDSINATITSTSSVIGYVNGSAYSGDFHFMDDGSKMTGSGNRLNMLNR